MNREQIAIELRELKETDFKKMLGDEFMKSAYSPLINLALVREIEEYDNAHLYSRRWYPHRIPGVGSASFSRYLASSRELAVHVTSLDDIRVHVSSAGTAYANIKSGFIALPKAAFSSAVYEAANLLDDLNFAMLSVVNGLIVHEAAHFAYSPDDLTKLTTLTPVNQVSLTVANVVEDLFIEERLARKFPFFKNFLSSAHHLYFHDNELFKRVVNVTETYVGGQYAGGAFLDLLIMLKNFRYRSSSHWGPLMEKYQTLLLDVLEDCEDGENQAVKVSRHKRERVTRNVYDALMEDEQLRWPDEIPGKAPGGLKPGEMDDPTIVIVVSGMGTDLSELDKLSPEEMARLDKEDGSVVTVEVTLDEESGLVRAHISEALDDQFVKDELERRAQREGTTTISRIPKTQVEQLAFHDRDFKRDYRYDGLGRLLRYKFTTATVPGVALKRGSRLVNTRLWRIATDQKIFSHAQKRKATGKDYEVAVLVDCSGSMHSGSKIEEAVTAGYSAYRSLKMSRIRTSLLGHTSRTHHSGDTPIVMWMGTPNESIKLAKMRAAQYYWRNSPMRNNFDGFAILKTAEIAFSRRQATKLLVVISDGQPAGASYYGDEAIAHTARAVREVRKRGILVIGISIERAVFEANDQIYGTRQNVKNTSPTILKDILQAILLGGGNYE